MEEEIIEYCPNCGCAVAGELPEKDQWKEFGKGFLSSLVGGFFGGKYGDENNAENIAQNVAGGTYALLSAGQKRQVFEFNCPRCGYSWRSHGLGTSPTPLTQAGYEQPNYNQEKIDNQENMLFNDEFNQFFEKENSILSSINSLRSYLNELDGIVKHNVENTVVKSEYRYLQAFVCSEYLYYVDASDFDIAKLGERKIDSAIQCNNDDEYKVLKQVLRSYTLDFEAPDILSIQKNYDQKCPNIQELQNTLIKTEYLDQVYRFSRFCSLLDTFLKLDEKGRCNQALDALKLMLKLNTPKAYITASAYLYECHWAVEKYKSFWDEDKAFRYAKQGADYAIDFMKSNYSPDDQLSKDWMELVVGTASRYHDGIGVEVDLSEAEKYLMIGVGHGDEECKKLLKELYESPSTNVANSTKEGKETGYSADGVSADIMNIVNNNKWYFHNLTQKYDFCFFLLEKESYSDVVENVKSILDTFPLGKEEMPLYLCGFFDDENDENSDSSWFLVTNSSIYCDSYEELVFDWNEVANISIENNILCIYFDRNGVSHRWELLPKLVTGDPDAPLEQWRSILQSFVEVSKSNTQSINNGNQIGITDSEKEYLDMVRVCLEDGEIGVRERKLLDKIRVKNGISEERAKELEATLNTPQLTDDEKEYFEAFKDACEDGKVSDKQRRLLEKLRVMYGISEERARELENM